MKFLTLVVFSTCLFAQTNMRKVFDEKRHYFFGGESERSSGVNVFTLTRFSDDVSAYVFQVAPELHIDFSEQIAFHFEGNVFKSHDYFQRHPVAAAMYQLKEFSGANYFTSEGYVNFNFSYGEIALGRFYDKIGVAPFKNLLVGNHDFHDGYRIKLRYEDFEFQNRFYQLASYRQSPLVRRYFFQHGVTWHASKAWTLSLSESAVYSGEREAPPFALLNPISVYHAAQLNNGLNSNTHYLVAAKYERENTAIWGEFLLDDFQVDSEDEGDGNKEPTEFGVILGASYELENHRFYGQFNLVRNRTYNDPNGDLSPNKFVDHGQVIGFETGSNLIGFDFEYWYKYSEKIQFQAQLEIAKRGDEAVFSPFDESYKGYENGHFEAIPFGNTKSSNDFWVSAYINIFEKTLGVVTLGTKSDNFFSALNFQYEF